MIGVLRGWCLALLLAAGVLAAAQGVVAEAAASSPLQERISKAQPGETIVLEPGIYEGPVAIDRPLTLRADREGASVIRNTSQDTALSITAENVAVIGLRIEDEMLKEAPTVLVRGRNARLEGLSILTGADGIAIRDAEGVHVSGTVVEWAPEGVPTADKGNGIDLYHAHQAVLTGNVIRNVHDGIYIENSDGTIVTENRIESSRYGIHCMYTKGTVIRDNDGDRNVTGAMVMAARHTEVSGNTFTKQSENVHSQGILLFDTHESKVMENRIEGNRVGLYVELSTNNVFERNSILNNYIGLQLLESENNSLTENLFAGNVANAAAKDSQNNNLSGNFWDAFRGLDTDGDGRSDISYAINPFFQGLSGKRPAFQLFFQSPGMVFLEGLYQADKSTWALDDSPLMKQPEKLRQQTAAGDVRQTGLAGLLLAAMAATILIWARRKRA
jgi:nitrous oxidase accessory protein